MGGSRNTPLWNRVKEGSRGAYKADNCVAGHLDPEVTLIKKICEHHNSKGSAALRGLEPFQSRSCPTLQPHVPQYTRPPYPSPSSKVCTSSCPLHCHLILWCPLLLLPSVFPSTSDFSNELAIWIRWPKYWSFSFSISPSNEYSGLISIKIDWFDLPAVHGTLSLLLQHDSLKASILWCSAFFMVQLSQLYMTTGKNIA